MGTSPYYVNYNELRDYEWNYDISNNRIRNVRRTARTRQIPLIVNGTMDDINHVYEVTEKDIIRDEFGTLNINGYIFKCKIYAASYRNYLELKGHCEINLKIVSEYPVWMSFTYYKFIKTGEVAAAGKSYPYGYDYDYGEGGLSNSVDGKGIEPNGFQMIIKGPVSNPEVVIGEHMYKVNTDVKVGETLTITAYGGKKTIYREGLTLSPVNEYSKRYLPESVFEPIQIGRQPVIWDGTFAFDLTLVEERSTPPWI